ncbi:uncharacterized protein LOC120141330 [Hibiscus syriacus]|uniref:uncharacterized protein LOC120141330 n=1 Tax=Hibiscus syriacus TaxID=106335 RepID=UPI001922C9CA|nr:uncharacterized protein LOC120141330 [Hibiscus syriacus]
MGRTVLSQLLILSNSSHRLSSSVSCGGLGSKYMKRPGFIRNNRAIIGDNGAGFRCRCTASLSQQAVPGTSSTSVRFVMKKLFLIQLIWTEFWQKGILKLQT